MKKKSFALLLSLTLCLSASLPAFAADTLPPMETSDEKQILSELSDDDLLLFLNKNNIVIPADLADSQAEAIRIVRSFIIDIEQNPDAEFAYGMTQLMDLGYSLKPAVNGYYEISVDSALHPYANYGLRDSTVYQIPSNKDAFNCYAYALGRTRTCNPGDFSGHPLTVTLLRKMSAYDLAGYVKEDLQSSSLNKPCVKITSTRPSYSSLVSGQTAICIRKGWGDDDRYDYHLMRLFSGDTWRHKPGPSAILTYDYLPSNSRNWTNEYYTGSAAVPGTLVYDGSIYYILFNSVHTYSHIYTGYNYHSGAKHYYEYADVCTICGAKKANTSTWSVISCSGPPCVDIVSLEAIN